MNLEEINKRGLFKFTGPPENWITCMKFMTWGLTEDYEAQWGKIEPGDIFLMHSMSTDTIVRNATSAIIGFGVVGTQFSKKEGPLWLREHLEKKNIWPLLVPFSEIYLFSQMIPQEALESPNGKNNEKISEEATDLLKEAILLSSVKGFPQMGSTSSVKAEVVAQIFDLAGKFYLYKSIDTASEFTDAITKPLPLNKMESAKDTLRKPTSLSDVEIVKKKTIKVGEVTYAKDNQLLERAEEAHYSTLEKLLNIMKSRGYDVYYNRHVDLFATNHKSSYLFEVKSIENHNFLPQARKGIVQLFEYEYFEVRKFFRDAGDISNLYKSLVMSRAPSDSSYVEFINNLGTGVATVENTSLKPIGEDLGLSTI
jgi:hypothetical protein